MPNLLMQLDKIIKHGRLLIWKLDMIIQFLKFQTSGSILNLTRGWGAPLGRLLIEGGAKWEPPLPLSYLY